VPWRYPLLAPGKYEEFGFPDRAAEGAEERFNLDAIRRRVETVHAQFTYGSISGREYDLNDQINVRSVTGDWIASRMMATQDHPDRLLPRMAKALDAIAQAIKRNQREQPD
jgi:hypothetical protein